PCSRVTRSGRCARRTIRDPAPPSVCSSRTASSASPSPHRTMHCCWPTATIEHSAPQSGPAMQKLAIVTTGGTIDKIYFDDKSTFQIGAPQIGEILEALGVAFEFDVVPLLRKD